MEREIIKELQEIKQYTLLGVKNVLTLEDTALLTGLSKSYLYKLTSTHQIPYYKQNGKNVYFDKAEIEDWMKQGKISPSLGRVGETATGATKCHNGYKDSGTTAIRTTDGRAGATTDAERAKDVKS